MTDVRAWPESGGPFRRLTQVLKDRGADTGRIGIEERVRFAVFEGLRKELPDAEFVSADPVTVGCRVIKSLPEILLMQRANDITIAAYRAAFATLHEGMTQAELRANISAAYAALGAQGNAMIIFGKYTAFPHGSIQPQTLHEGDMVLVDDGCSVEGYQSDITRTTVFGKPTARQRDIWNSGAQSAGRRAGGTAKAGSDVRIGGCRRAEGDYRLRFRTRLSGSGPAPPHGPRDRTGRARVDHIW